MRVKNRKQNCLLKEDICWINRKDHVDEYVTEALQYFKLNLT